MQDWKDLYNIIRDPSWPDYENYNDIPVNIRLEMFEEHGFKQPHNNLLLEYTDQDYAGFVYNLENWLKEIGSDTDALCSRRDLLFIYTTIYNTKPNSVLEIGRYKGSSTLTIAGALADNNVGHVWSIDIVDLLNDTVKNHIKDYATLITTSSDCLWNNTEFDRTFDVCFVDGNHSYKMVLNDLEFCAARAPAEQIILAHDNDYHEVQDACHMFLQKFPEYTDCGNWGDNIRVLRKLAT